MSPPNKTNDSPKAQELRRQGALSFQADLPKLMATHLNQWIAYHGKDTVGYASTKTKLNMICQAQGLKYEELYIRKVQSDIPVSNMNWSGKLTDFWSK